MPALPPTDLPGCCTAPAPLPPLAEELDALALLHCRFDPAQVSFERDALRLGALPPDNIRRAVAKRQAEYLAGRLCAREALRQLSGAPAVPGHRREDRGPAWPAGWVGAIPNRSSWADGGGGSARDYLGLGLDVETLLEPAKALRLADQILTPTERESVQALDEAQQAFAITLAFSAKESLFKALHPQVGQMFFFQDAEILDSHPGGTFDIRLLIELSPRWSAGTSLRRHFRLDEERRLLTLIAPRH